MISSFGWWAVVPEEMIVWFLHSDQICSRFIQPAVKHRLKVRILHVSTASGGVLPRWRRGAPADLLRRTAGISRSSSEPPDRWLTWWTGPPSGAPGSPAGGVARTLEVWPGRPSDRWSGREHMMETDVQEDRRSALCRGFVSEGAHHVSDAVQGFRSSVDQESCSTVC